MRFRNGKNRKSENRQSQDTQIEAIDKLNEGYGPLNPHSLSIQGQVGRFPRRPQGELPKCASSGQTIAGPENVPSRRKKILPEIFTNMELSSEHIWF